jgi:hypothetical protein
MATDNHSDVEIPFLDQRLLPRSWLGFKRHPKSTVLDRCNYYSTVPGKEIALELVAEICVDHSAHVASGLGV